MNSNQFDALYQPRYVPDPDWLKTQLLIWDRIFRIVPYEMQDQFGDAFIDEHLAIDPAFLPMLSPSPSDLIGYKKHKETLRKAFQMITEKAKGEMRESHEFGVHPRKAPAWLFDMLEEFGLAKTEQSVTDPWDSVHRMIQEDAGHLVLSCLGDSMASRRGLDQLTDSDLTFFVNSAIEVGGGLDDLPSQPLESMLAIAVFKLYVPKDLSSVPVAEVLEIRKEYSELRHSFHSTIRKLSSMHNLNGIVEPKFAEDALKSCLREFALEEKKFNKGRARRFFSDWRVQSFAVLLGAIGATLAGEPIVGMSLVLGETTVQLANVLSDRPEPSDEEKSFKYLQKLGKKLDAKKCSESIQALLPD